MSAAGHIGVKLESVVGAIRDRLDIARFLFEFISEGKSFVVVDSLCSTLEPSRKKDEEGKKKEIKIKNNFEIGSKRILNFTIECATVSQVVVA